MKEHKRMTVGDLRRAMKGLPDDRSVVLEIEISDYEFISADLYKVGMPMLGDGFSLGGKTEVKLRKVK
jgi:hypothetical protein